jgi:hypothetical protein
MFAELEDQLYVNRFLVPLDSFFGSRAPLKEKCEFVIDILGSKDSRFARIHEALIDTKSNLSSTVLRDICTICSIDFARFEKEASFIDTVVLKRRNSIAHGEEQYVDANDVEDLISRSIALMRDFKNQLENRIYEEKYKAA